GRRGGVQGIAIARSLVRSNAATSLVGTSQKLCEKVPGNPTSCTVRWRWLRLAQTLVRKVRRRFSRQQVVSPVFRFALRAVPPQSESFLLSFFWRCRLHHIPTKFAQVVR